MGQGQSQVQGGFTLIPVSKLVNVGISAVAGCFSGEHIGRVGMPRGAFVDFVGCFSEEHIGRGGQFTIRFLNRLLVFLRLPPGFIAILSSKPGRYFKLFFWVLVLGLGFYSVWGGGGGWMRRMSSWPGANFLVWWSQWWLR